MRRVLLLSCLLGLFCGTYAYAAPSFGVWTDFSEYTGTPEWPDRVFFEYESAKPMATTCSKMTGVSDEAAAIQTVKNDGNPDNCYVYVDGYYWICPEETGYDGYSCLESYAQWFADTDGTMWISGHISGNSMMFGEYVSCPPVQLTTDSYTSNEYENTVCFYSYTQDANCKTTQVLDKYPLCYCADGYYGDPYDGGCTQCPNSTPKSVAGENLTIDGCKTNACPAGYYGKYGVCTICPLIGKTVNGSSVSGQNATYYGCYAPKDTVDYDDSGWFVYDADCYY